MIFANNAPIYWENGLNVIPLITGQKYPEEKGWQRWCRETIPGVLKETWLQQQANGNMGLALGSASGVVVIDIDTTDSNLIDLIRRILPKSPWEKRGAKGVTLAFKDTGGRTFRIKGLDGKTIVEHLAEGTQTVLPPSIHPDTKRPYESNVPLYQVKDQLVGLPTDIESKLRVALRDAGVVLSQSGRSMAHEKVPVGARDVSLNKFAGQLAYDVMRGMIPLKRAFQLMRSRQVEQSDEIDIEKFVNQIVSYIHKDLERTGNCLPPNWDEDLTADEREACKLDHLEEWNYEQFKKFIVEGIEINPEGSAGRRAMIETVTQQLARAKHMKALDSEEILQMLRSATGGKITLTVLRKAMKENANERVQDYSHREYADLMIEDYEKVSKIHFHNDQFWQWGGSHWEPIPMREVRGKIAETFGHLLNAKKFNDHSAIAKTMADAVPAGLGGRDGINFANGLLTNDGELIPHDSMHGKTYTLPFDYNPKAADKAVRWMEFLEQCWGQDPDFEQKKMALQEAICVTLLGQGPARQRCVLLYGPSKSGKSTVMGVVEGLMPDSVRSVVPPEQWTDKFQVTMLAEKLLNSCGELEGRTNIGGKIFKQIVGGEEAQGQFKNQQIFKFKPKAMHWFASNHLPRTKDTSDGFTRRWLVLTFRRQVKEHARVLLYHEVMLAEEREAIAAWAMRALNRVLQTTEYTLPDSHEVMISEMDSRNNTISGFLNDVTRVARDENSSVGFDELYRAYEIYFRTIVVDGLIVRKPEFRGQMTQLEGKFGFQTIDVAGNTRYKGLKLLGIRMA